MSDAAPPPSKSRWEGPHYLVVLLAALQVTLYVVPQFRPGLAGVVCWLLGGDQVLWLGITGVVFFIAIVLAARRRPFWNCRRAIGYAALLGLVLSPRAFCQYPSSFDDRPSPIRFRLPLDGPVTVAWGGATPDINYHVVAPDQRWAYDLLVTHDGKSHRGEGTHVEDYYCYGQPIVAPADGVVHAVSDGDPDMPIGVLGGGKSAGGNEVVLKVSETEFLFLCHMQPGSLTVKAGDTVTEGQVLGKVGNSGNTSEPHLHIHLQHGPEPFVAEGIPLLFHNYRAGDQIIERGIPTGGFDGSRFTGQIVEHVGVK